MGSGPCCWNRAPWREGSSGRARAEVGAGARLVGVQVSGRCWLGPLGDGADGETGTICCSIRMHRGGGPGETAAWYILEAQAAVFLPAPGFLFVPFQEQNNNKGTHPSERKLLGCSCLCRRSVSLAGRKGEEGLLCIKCQLHTLISITLQGSC